VSVPSQSRNPERCRPEIGGGDVQFLFVHLQADLVAGSATVAPDALARAVAALAEVAGLLSLPTAFSVVPERGDLVAGLRAHASSGNTFDCHAASAFRDPATVSALAKAGRRTLVVAGFATEVATLHSCLDAAEAGYHVVLPVDATGGLSSRTEDAAFRQLEAAGVLLTSVHGLAAGLAPDFARSPGKEVLDVMQSLKPA
jgi:nicotinamidase-related amidase